MFSKPLQYKMKMFGVFFFILGIHKDIILINYDEFVEVVHEDIVHQTERRSFEAGNRSLALAAKRLDPYGLRP
jgi:hypothetical protein